MTTPTAATDKANHPDNYPTDAEVVALIKQAGGDWQQAANLLTDLLIGRKCCFTSGHIVRCLRLADQSLRFAVTRVGEQIRDAFYSGTMLDYDDGQGNKTYPVQVSRQTTGKYPDRTPAGQDVFVYGADQAACDAFEFEVCIPKPGKTADDDPDPVQAPPPAAPAPGDGAQPAAPAGPTITGRPASASPVVIAGAKPGVSTFKATVHADRRLCIGRSAFEACVHASGKPMRGTDPVYVTLKGDKALVSQDKTGDPDEQEYSLVASRGRVLFPSGDSAKPFVPGDVYNVTVGNGTLEVDLSAPVNIKK